MELSGTRSIPLPSGDDKVQPVVRMVSSAAKLTNEGHEAWGGHRGVVSEARDVAQTKHQRQMGDDMCRAMASMFNVASSRPMARRLSAATSWV